jgi:hypothetical protein
MSTRSSTNRQQVSFCSWSPDSTVSDPNAYARNTWPGLTRPGRGRGPAPRSASLHPLPEPFSLLPETTSSTKNTPTSQGFLPTLNGGVSTPRVR